jgi:hypothetical protein
MDFYNNGIVGDPDCAYTEKYVNTTQVNPNNSDWWWARVYATPTLKNSAICGNTAHRQGIIAHEQGHVMGLDHLPSGSARLMYTYIAGTNVNAPQPDEVVGINFLY